MNLRKIVEADEEMGTIDVNTEKSLDWMQLRRTLMKEKDGSDKTSEKDRETDTQEQFTEDRRREIQTR